MERSYRPLLPSKGSSSSEGGSPAVQKTAGLQKPRKRQQIIVACSACRKRKSKCDGIRPTCNTCVAKDTACAWAADPDAPPIVALKRKYDALMRESQNLRDLFELLKTRPDQDAMEILKSVRSGEDIGSTLKAFESWQEDTWTEASPVMSESFDEISEASSHPDSKKRETEIAVRKGKEAVSTFHASAYPTTIVPHDTGSPRRKSPIATPGSTPPRRVSIMDLLNTG